MDTVTIPKDEYIELLRCRAALAERRLAAVKAPKPFVPREEPGKWMNRAEKAEILRLHGEGLSSREISEKVGRPASSVRRYIVKMRGPGARA